MHGVPRAIVCQRHSSVSGCRGSGLKGDRDSAVLVCSKRNWASVGLDVVTAFTNSGELDRMAADVGCCNRDAEVQDWWWKTSVSRRLELGGVQYQHTGLKSAPQDRCWYTRFRRLECLSRSHLGRGVIRSRPAQALGGGELTRGLVVDFDRSGSDRTGRRLSTANFFLPAPPERCCRREAWRCGRNALSSSSRSKNPMCCGLGHRVPLKEARVASGTPVSSTRPSGRRVAARR